MLQGCGEAPPPHWNVLLVTFDTTRADHLQPYGNDRAATPTLQGLASEGFLFEQAYSAAPITAPSHSTILTGRYPIAHGVRDNGLFVLADQELTLAEILRQNGYATAAAIGAYPVITKFGFSQGFDLFDDRLTGNIEDHLGERIAPKDRLFFDERRAAQVNEAVLPWLNQHAGKGKPFFIWLHYFDPHQPFEPPSPFDQRYADDLYAGEIAYADQALGRMLDHLRKLGELDRTLIVMTADHGEGLGEHGELTHAVLAYNSTLHVPLIIRPPAAIGGGMRISEHVGSVDIVPTILDLLRIKVPDAVQGRSLAPLMRGEAGEWRQYYAENMSPHMSHGWGKLRVLFDGSYKYIHGPRPELYDLSKDPAELNNLLAERPAEGQRMHEELALFLQEFASGESVSTPVDEETLRNLQSLGYLQSGTTTAVAISETLEEGGIPPHEHVSLLNDMSAAKHLLFMKRYADAEVYTRKLIAASPDSPNYVEMHLAALMGSGRADEAWEYMQQPRAIPYQPTEPIITALALARFSQGDQASARKALLAYAQAHCSARAYWTVAGFNTVQGDAKGEWDGLEAALACDPGYVRARVDLAIRRARDGDVAGAEDDFQRALRDAPYDSRTTYNFGTFLLSQDRPEEAQQLFERTLSLTPDYWKAHLALVATALQQGRRDEALRWMEALERAAPHSPEAKAAGLLMSDSGQAAQ